MIHTRTAQAAIEHCDQEPEQYRMGPSLSGEISIRVPNVRNAPETWKTKEQVRISRMEYLPNTMAMGSS